MKEFFFLKVWAKTAGAHYIQQNIVILPNRGPGPEQVCLGPGVSVWVLDFVLERFRNTGPGD